MGLCSASCPSRTLRRPFAALQDLLSPLSAFTASTTFRPISAVEIAVMTLPARSAVRAPFDRTAKPRSPRKPLPAPTETNAATTSPPTKSLPADSQFPSLQCPEPIREPAHTSPTGPPILADASSPSDPTTPPAWSDKMSPNMFSVSTTSKSAGRCTSSIAAESTY